MAEPFFPLTALSEAQRAQASERFTIIRPALEEGVSRVQVARTSKKAPSTIQLWIKRYREKGLAGLANNVSRSDKGTSRTLEDAAIRLTLRLALQTPPRSMAAIHRQVTTSFMWMKGAGRSSNGRWRTFSWAAPEGRRCATSPVRLERCTQSGQRKLSCTMCPTRTGEHC